MDSWVKRLYTAIKQHILTYPYPSVPKNRVFLNSLAVALHSLAKN